MKAHIQAILYALGAVIVAVSIVVLNDKWKDGQEAVATIEIMKPIAKDTTVTINEGVVAEAARKAYELGVNKARDEFKQQQAEDKRNDPETAARADRVVPRSVRNNFQKRRAARERLGCPSGECAEGDAAQSAPER